MTGLFWYVGLGFLCAAGCLLLFRDAGDARLRSPLTFVLGTYCMAWLTPLTATMLLAYVAAPYDMAVALSVLATKRSPKRPLWQAIGAQITCASITTLLIWRALLLG